MTGSGAVMPQAPSLPPQGAAKVANSLNAAEIDTAETGCFSELFAALKGEADAPNGPERDADVKRDDNAGAPSMQMPIALLPEKTPQARFAEELNATLSPGFGQVSLASVPPAAEALPPETEAEPPAKSDMAKPASPATPPVAGGIPAQPPLVSQTAGTVTSAPPSATPEPMPTIPSAPPLSAPATLMRPPRERNAIKGLHQESSALTEATATTVDGTDPLAASSETAASENRSSQEGERGDATRTVAAAKETKISVVHQETHFAPGPQQSPAYQIANRIVHDVETADPASMAQQPTALSKDASTAPVKVLHIQLDPPELGALTVRMSLKDDALHLQIEVSRHETARLIERDRVALSGMLRSAGYSVDGLSVQITTSDRGAGAQQFTGAGGFGQSAGQHSAGQQPEDNGSGQAWQRVMPERIAENGRETEPRGAHMRRGGTVYL